MKALFVGAVLLAFLNTAMAAGSDTAHQASMAKVDNYKYGTHLDISKVLSVSTPANSCDVVPEKMIYLDSTGLKHELDYQVVGDGCNG
ncbi:DUF2790 domain-containing protein [Pseudomonas sp. NA-150]|uniref:DUF2790 domain-containing protein n=1 Tax=Pseudomonas sp. NA-150 TaxID=3367525 RepID=UPI0037C4F540